MKTMIGKLLITCLSIALSLTSVGLPTAQAAIIGTKQLLDEQRMAADQQKIVAFLDRAEVRQELQRQGVNPDVAKARVAALNDEEAHLLAGKIDTLPAGGMIESVIGAAVFIFLVLLITDILGLTDVYPFVHHG